MRILVTGMFIPAATGLPPKVRNAPSTIASGELATTASARCGR
jgi:hypothetical protein